MESRPKRSCAKCGKTGKLYKETKTDTIVCSVECAKEALQEKERHVETSVARPSHVTVDTSSPIGRVLGDLHGLIGSERFGMLMKKGKAYDWTNDIHHDVPEFLHSELEKHIGPEQDGGGGSGGKKRTKSEQESTDEPGPGEKQQGGEQKRVPQREDVQIVLSTQGTVATSYAETLPLDVWKSVIRKGGWDALEAMMDPFGNRWVLENPPEFFQMVLDLFVYGVSASDPTERLRNILINHSTHAIRAMFSPLLSDSLAIRTIIQDDKKDKVYLFSPFVFQIFHGELLNGFAHMSGYDVFFPTLSGNIIADIDQYDLVIDSGIPLRLGPVIWPIFAMYKSEREIAPGSFDLAKEVTTKMLQKRGFMLRPADVGMAVFANPELFDIVLLAAKQNNVPLINVLKELAVDMNFISDQNKLSKFEPFLDAKKITYVVKSASSRLVTETQTYEDVILENLAKLPDYGGSGCMAILRKFFGQQMADKYASADFPVLDLEGLIVETLTYQKNTGYPNYDVVEKMYERLTRTNKTVENNLTASLLFNYIQKAVKENRPVEEMSTFMAFLLPHVRDASILFYRDFIPGTFYDKLTSEKKYAPLLYQATKASGFTMTPEPAYVHRFVPPVLEKEERDGIIMRTWRNRVKTFLTVSYLNIEHTIQKVIDETGFDRDRLFANADLGRVFYATTASDSFTLGMFTSPVLVTYLNSLLTSQPSEAFKSYVTPEWIMEHCNIAENDNLLCALLVLWYSEESQKRLCDLAAAKMTPTEIRLQTRQIMKTNVSDDLVAWSALRMFFYNLEFDIHPDYRDKYKMIQEMFVYLVDLMYQRHGAISFFVEDVIAQSINLKPAFNVPKIYLDLAKVIKQHTGDTRLYKRLLQFAHQDHVLEAVLANYDFKDAREITTEVTELIKHQETRKKKPVLALLTKMITKFPPMVVSSEFKNGKFLQQLVNQQYSDGDITEDLMKLLTPIFPMDFKFTNGGTFLHMFAHYLDPLQIIKKYREVTKKIPDLFLLDSNGVSVIGIFFWHHPQPYDALRKLAAEYGQYTDYRQPHVLLGMSLMDHRMLLGQVRVPLKNMKDEAREKVVHLLGGNPSDAMLFAQSTESPKRAWWSCGMGRTIAYFLSSRYPRLNMKAYVDGDGNNALLSYFLYESVRSSALDLNQVEQLLKVGVSVSQLNSSGSTSAIHSFVVSFEQNKTTKAILKRLIQHVTFDNTIKPTQGGKKNMTAKEVAALSRKFDFVAIFEKFVFTPPAAAASSGDVQMSDAAAMEQ